LDIQNNIGLDILNSLSDYIAVLDEEGIIIYTNKAWDEYYVKNKTGLINHKSDVGDNYLELCLKASKINEEALKTYEGINLVISGEANSFASSYLLDGNKWFTVSVEPLAGDRVMVTHKNVTGQVITDEEIVMDKVKFQYLFYEANIGMVLSDDSFHFIQVNKSFCDFIGYTENELRKLTPIDITVSDDIEETKVMMNYMTENKENNKKIEKRYRRKDGGIVWGETSNRLIKSASDKILHYATIIDITANKKSEMDLIESESRLKLATESANIGIWDWDVKENILVWDDSMYKLYDVEKSNFSGALDAWQKTLFPDDFDAANKEVEYALSGKKNFNTTFRIITRDGAIKHIHAQGNVQFDANKEAIRMTGINMDVTNKVLMEQEKHNAIIKTEETERLRLSHDLHDGLGQTIAAANMCFNALSDYAKDQLDEEALSMFNTGKELINDATKETRIVSHNIMPRSLSQFGLERAIDEMISNYKKITESTNIIFNSNIGDLRFNKEKELALFRVVQESLSNALKHSKAKSIYVNIILENEQLNISISDNGVGFKLDEVQEANIGIGLVSLSQRIDMIGGRLNIETDLDEGTKINIAVTIV